MVYAAVVPADKKGKGIREGARRRRGRTLRGKEVKEKMWGAGSPSWQLYNILKKRVLFNMLIDRKLGGSKLAAGGGVEERGAGRIQGFGRSRPCPRVSI